MAKKNKSPLVSIALASYNGEKFIEEQINSILSQTYLNIEIIISDDNSTDTTMDILQQLKKQNSNIKVVLNTKLRGYINNFVNAIEHCTGDYIALCDQDDIWLPDKLEKQVSVIGTCDIAASDMVVVDADSNLIAPSLMKYQGFYRPEKKDHYRYLVLRNSYTGATMLMKADFAKRCLPIPMDSMVHDWWFAVNAAAGNGIVFIDEPLVKYRQHGKNSIGAIDRSVEAYQGLLYIFSKRRKIYMLNRFSNYQKRVQSYIDRKIFKDADDLEFLQIAEKYYAGYTSLSGKLSTLSNGFKIRKYLYPDDGLIISLAKLLVKVI